jgi:ATP-dependent DNA helicase Rep
LVSKKRQHYGESVDAVPSRFLEELPQDDLDWEEDHIPLTNDEKREKGKGPLARLR